MLIPNDVLAEARRDAYVWPIRKALREHMRPIECDGRVVGFCYPRMTRLGFRLGPVFVIEAYRRRGLLRKAYDEHANGRPCIAFIKDSNVASQEAHRAIGFWPRNKAYGGAFWVREC